MKPSTLNSLLAVLCVGAVVIGAESWMLHRVRAQTAEALVRLEQAKQERDALETVSPSPTPKNENTIAAGLAEVRAHLAGLQRQLQAGAEAVRSDAATLRPRDVFFELADMVEKARAQAAAARVTVRPDERFGFATYATEGPDAKAIPAISRQQRIVQSTLESLFEARPSALLGLRRVPPDAEDQSTKAEDGFAWETGLSLRQPGLVDVEPVRFEFTGQTSTLRMLLAQIAALRQPAIVRSVDVEALPAPAGETTAAAGGPVVGQGISKFTVTVEYLLPAAVPEKPAS